MTVLAECFLARGACDIRFGASRVTTLLKRGLIELLPEGTSSLPLPLRTTTPPAAAPTTSALENQKRSAKSRTRQDVFMLMCQYGIVVFESGIEDISSPPSSQKNEAWRSMPMAAYRNRLHALMEVWKGCKRANPRWRGIYKLALAPRAHGLHEVSEASSDCVRGGSQRAAHPHHVHVLNAVARRAVEVAGFEVFDPFAATLHARAEWFDVLHAGRGGRSNQGVNYQVHSAEALSDMVTQMLLNQLCG